MKYLKRLVASVKSKRLIVGVALVVGVSICLTSCTADRQVELVSSGPNKSRQIRLVLESSVISPKARLAIEAIYGDRVVRFEPSEVSKIGDESLGYNTFELGVCFSEIAWPDDNTAVIFVKNCLGKRTMVAVDFELARLRSGASFDDSLRRSIELRYKKQLKSKQQDVLEWVDTDEAAKEYRWRRLGDGRLME
jgi:hypothetical protein